MEFAELLSPVSLEDNVLVCNKMKLGDADASGRRRPVETGETVTIPADTLIAATGEQVNGAWYQVNGILTDDRGRAKVNEQTLETSVEGVYVEGDGVNGPAPVVEAIRDASLAAAVILGDPVAVSYTHLYWGKLSWKARALRTFSSAMISRFLSSVCGIVFSTHKMSFILLTPSIYNVFVT